MPCSSCQQSSSHKEKSHKDKSSKDHKDRKDKCKPKVRKFYPDDPDGKVFVGYYLCEIPACSDPGQLILLPNGRVYQLLEGSWIQLDTGDKFYFGDVAADQVYYVQLKGCDKAKIRVIQFCAHYKPLSKCGKREYFSWILTKEEPQCLVAIPEPPSPEQARDSHLQVFFQ